MAQGRGYYNLFDPGCTDWMLCTGEGGSSKGWLNGAGPFTILQDWTDNVDQLSFTPAGGKKTVDLSATSPTGVISAPQWYVTVNACGGSSHNACGLWDGPTKGGPLGVIYSKVTLELIAECGNDECSPGIETTQSCPTDCGGAGSGGTAGSGGAAGQSGAAGLGADGGVSGGAGIGGAAGSTGGDGSGGSSGAAAQAGSSANAGAARDGGAASSDDGGCGCRAPRRGPQSPWQFLVLAGFIAAARRRRGRDAPRQ